MTPPKKPESTAVILSEIRTSLRFIEKRLEQDDEFKDEVRKKQSKIETAVAVHTQELRNVSEKIDTYSQDRKACKANCDGTIGKVETIALENRILVQKNISFVKWTAGFLAILVPSLIAVAQIVFSVRSDAHAFIKPTPTATQTPTQHP